jgi:Divergent InlB B-repeat domain
MLRARALVVGLALAFAACDGSGSGGAPTAPAGGEGGGGNGGSAGGSLSRRGFRTVAVTVTPAGAGLVSDNLAEFGSAVRDCATCRERYRLGTAVVLTATPAGAARFDRWQGGPCDGSPGSTCAFTVSSDLELTAVFR